MKFIALALVSLPLVWAVAACFQDSARALWDARQRRLVRASLQWRRDVEQAFAVFQAEIGQRLAPHFGTYYLGSPKGPRR